MIKVLIVDDSRTAQENLKFILNSDPDIEIIGAVNNGREALDFIKKNKPDVITMDLIMPVLNGFETTRIIMETDPIPIVVISGSDSIDEINKSFRAFEAGTLALLEKPTGIKNLSDPKIKYLIRTVKTMSNVKLVRRWQKGKYDTQNSYTITKNTNLDNIYDIVVIGASTGGPPALLLLLKEIEPNFPLPILIVQHIAKGFIEGMVNWLSTETGLKIVVAKAGDKLMPATVYLAPDDFQMGVTSGKQVILKEDLTPNSIKPSVSHLFGSVVSSFGKRSIAILLTGMGKDGSKELKLLKETGALTIIQDEESSVVFGMPGAAKLLGAASKELNPTDIGKLLNSIVNENIKN